MTSRRLELLYLVGTQQRRLGRLEEALAGFTRAASLDRRSEEGPAQIADVHDMRSDCRATIRARDDPRFARLAGR